MKGQIYTFLNGSRWGSILITSLIFLSIIMFSLETEYSNNPTLKLITYSIAVLFLIEYILRIWTANHEPTSDNNSRIKYIFSFYGIVDLLAFLPVLLFPAANGSVILRILRLLRLIQLMKLKTVTNGISRVFKAIHQTRTELLISLSVSLAFIFLGAVLMFLIEGNSQPESFGSIPRALWWSMATLTTVGYGDVYPITPLGKLVASLMALVGIAAVAMPAGILAAAFTNSSKQ